MADFVATIQVKFELLGLTGAGSTSRAPSEAGGVSTGSLGIDELRREFAELASQVRAVAAALRQIDNARSGGVSSAGGERPATGGVSASGASGDAPNADEIRDATKAANDLFTVLAKITGAAKEASEATDLLEETYKKTAEDAKTAADSLDEAAEAERRRIAALKALTRDTPDRSAGRLNVIRRFTDVFQGIANNPEFRAKAESARKVLADTFIIPPNITRDAQERGEALKKRIGTIVRNLFESITSNTATPRSISEAQRQIRQTVGRSNEQVIPSQRVQFDEEEAFRRIASAALLRRIELGSKTFNRIADELESFSDVDFVKAKADLEGVISDIEDLVESRARRIFTSRSGQDPLGGSGAGILRELQQEVGIRPPPIELPDRAQRAFNQLNEAATKGVRPLTAVARAIDIIVDGGRGLNAAEENIRQLVDELKRFANRANFPSSEDFLRFQETVNLIGRVRADRAGGIRGPEGTVSREAGIFAGRQAVSNLRSQLAGRFQETGVPQKDFLDINVPTATGGIKKVRVELEALGGTLDRVRVKGREVSDNMFDRTSVKAALERVATWGAAAGIVFGAVDAFRGALRTLIDTEAAVVGLAKVMDESTKDFEGFKATAIEAATAIAENFGQPLEGVLETLTLFGQQGKGLADAINLTKAASLAANVTVLDQTTAASTLTAVISQFGKEASDATSIIDKFNEVSNNAAVTEQVLGEAILKAGQAASNAGVNLDEFNAIVAAISERTRQSGNEIGTALRFVFSRLQTDEAASGLQAIGISVRDAAGNVRPFTDLLRELATAFQDLTDSQKQQVAISVSGTRRFNTFLALVENFSQFQDSLADSVNSAGSAFREQEKVTQTADFRIRQFRNSLEELAISFGDAVLDPLKLIISSLSTFTNAITAIPGSIKVLAAGVGLGTIAFVKLSDQIVDFLGLAGAVRGAGSTFGGALSRNLFRGVPEGLQATLEPDRFLELSGATIAAREVGDVAGLTRVFRGSSSEVKTFAQALSSSGRELVGLNGQALKNTASFTKFGAVVRGLGTRELNAVGAGASVATLGIKDLNSGLTRFVAAIGLIGNRISRLPVLATIFAGLDAAAQSSVKSVSAVGSALGTLGRFALVGGAIFLLVEGFNALRDAAFTTGEDIERSLRPELAARTEAIALIEKQRNSLDNLVSSRRQLARQTVTTSGSLQDLNPLEAERVRRGGFTGGQGSPLLQNRRLLEQQRDITESIILSRPELVDSIDAFGNASLTSADSFDQLAASAENVQKTLFNLTQLRVVEGFAADLRPRDDFLNSLGDFARDVPGFGRLVPDDFAKNVGNQFEEAKAAFEGFLNDPAVREAQDLGIPLEIIDPDKAREGREAAERFLEGSLNFRALEKVVNDQIAKIQPDADALVFQILGRDQRDLFRRQADRLSSEIGEAIDPSDIINQRFIQNRSSFRDITNLIGSTAEESAARFRESGIVEEVIRVEDSVQDVQKALRGLRGGELVLFQDAQGFTRQGVAQILSDGRQQIVGIADDLGNTFTKTFQEVLENADIRIIDPDQVREQIELLRLEVSRVPTGAGRGSILTQDLDLGAASRADVSAQQRSAQQDENLIARFLDLQRRRETQLGRIGVSGNVDQGQEASQRVSVEFREEIRKLNIELDRTASAIKFREVIEEVARSFESAVDDIARQRIGDRISAEFSGVFGAASGILAAGFQQPRFEDELSGEQRFDRGNPELIELLNQISRNEQAAGEQVAGLLSADRDINNIFRAFSQAQEAGGVRDPNRLSALQRQAASLRSGGLEQAEALNTAIADQQLNEQVETNSILRQIAAQLSDQPILFGAALADSVTRGALTNPETADLFTSQVAGADVSQFSTEDIRRLSQGFSEAKLDIPQNLLEELTSRQADKATAQLTSAFLNNENNIAPSFLTDIVRQTVRDTQGTAGDRSSTGNTISRPSRERTEFQRALQEVLSGIDLSEILRNGVEGELVIQGETVDNAIVAVISRLLESPLENVRQAAVELGTDFAANGEEAAALRASFKTAVETFTAVRRNVQPEAGPAAPETDLESERRLRRSEINRIVESNRALKDFISPLKEAAAAALQFGRATADSALTIRNSVQGAADELQISRDIGRFAAPQVGLLSGVGVPDVQLDSRRRLSELSGRELTALERPELSAGLTNASAVFESLVGALETVRREQLLAGRRRESFRSQGNTAGVEAADEALRLLGGTASTLERQILSAQGSFRQLGETFRDLEAVNQLRVDIESLFESFEQQRNLQFDRTSIETALGRGPFAFSRPTFEQFEQGQGGRLTSFERRLAELEAPARGPQSLSDILGRGRDVRRVQFEQRESVIGFAQQRENQQFETQIRQAEQVRERLFQFASQGGPGAEIARSLVNQLTTELEQAGDLLPTTGGPRTIRDPRTGADVQVPASEILQFRGVPGLEAIRERVSQLAQQFDSSRAEEEARFITEPLLGALDTTNDLLSNINDNFSNIGNASESTNNLVAAFSQVSTQIGNVVRAVDGDVSVEDERGINELLGVLETFDPSVLSTVLEANIIKFSDGSTKSLREALSKVASEVSNVGLRDSILSLFEDASGAGTDTTAADQLNELFRLVSGLGGGSPGEEAQALDTKNLTASADESALALTKVTSAADALSRAFNNLAQARDIGAPSQGLATGGLVVGPGGPRDDRVPIRASSGEFVLNADAVRRIGADKLVQLNRGGARVGPDASDSGSSARFQEGGLVALEKFESGDQEIKRLLELNRALTRLQDRRKGLAPRAENDASGFFGSLLNNVDRDIEDTRAEITSIQQAQESRLGRIAELQEAAGTGKLSREQTLEAAGLVKQQRQAVAATQQLERFSQAEVQLKKNLQERTSRFFSGLPQEAKIAFSALRTAESALSGEGDRGVDDFKEITRDLRRSARVVGPKIKQLKGTKESELSLLVPPTFERTPRGDRLRQDEFASVGVFNDPETNEVNKFIPRISGFAILTNEAREEFIQGLLGANLDTSLEAAAEVVEKGGSFRSFAQRENLVGKGARAIARLRADSEGELTGVPGLDFVLDKGLLVAGSAASIAEGAGVGFVGNFGDLVGGDPEAARRAQLSFLTLGGADIGEFASNFTSNLARQGGDIADLEVRLDQENDPNKKKEIRRAIAEAEQNLAGTVSGAALLAAGGVQAVKGVAGRPVTAGRSTSQGFVRNARARARARKISTDELQTSVDRTRFELDDPFISRRRQKRLQADEVALQRRIDAARSKEARALARKERNKAKLQKEVDRLGPSGVERLIEAVRGRSSTQAAAEEAAEDVASKRVSRARSSRAGGQADSFDVSRIELEQRAIGAEVKAQKAAAEAETTGRAIDDASVESFRRDLEGEDFGIGDASANISPLSATTTSVLEDFLGLNLLNSVRNVLGATVGKLPGVSRATKAAGRAGSFLAENFPGGRATANFFGGPLNRFIFGGKRSGIVAGSIRAGIGAGVGLGPLLAPGAGFGTFGALAAAGSLVPLLPRLFNASAGLLSRVGPSLGRGFSGIGAGIRRTGQRAGRRLSNFDPISQLNNVDRLTGAEIDSLTAQRAPTGINRRPIDLLAAAEANRGLGPQAGASRNARVAGLLRDITNTASGTINASATSTGRVTSGPSVIAEGAAPRPAASRTNRLQDLIASLREEPSLRTVDPSSVISGAIEGPGGGGVIRPPSADVPSTTLPTGRATEAQLAAGRARAAELDARTAAAARRGIPTRQITRGPDVLPREPSVIVEGQTAGLGLEQFPELAASRQRLLDFAEGRLTADEFDPTGTISADIEAARVQELQGLRRRERERIEAAERENRAFDVLGQIRQEQAGFSGFDRAGSSGGTAVARRPSSPPIAADVNPLVAGRLRDLAAQFGLDSDFFLRRETQSAANTLRPGQEPRPQIFGNQLLAEDFTNLSAGARQAVEEVIAAAQGPAAFENLLGRRIETTFSPESLAAGVDPDQVLRAREAFASRRADIEQARSQGFDASDIDQLERQIREEIADRFGVFPNQFADGGKITGPGGPRSDRVPIMASAGEFVLNANSVNRIGLPNVEMMNRTGRLPRFQDGGLITLDEIQRRGLDNNLKSLLDDSSIFDQIRGAAPNINATAALKQLRGGDGALFVNQRTGEEVVASPLAARGLVAQGFSEPVDPDLEILNALSSGGEIFENPQTGETIVSSGLLAGELRRRGFRPSDKPISSVLSRSALINQDGSISLVSNQGLAGPQSLSTPFERALQKVPQELRSDPEVRRNVLLGTNLEIEKRRSPTDFAFDGGGFSSLPGDRFTGSPRRSVSSLQGSLDSALDDFDEDRLKRAAGGSIFGPGGPRSDSVPILASNGEFIFSSDSVNRIGLPALQLLNSGGDLSNLPKFQDGGLVGGGSGAGSIEISISADSISTISSAVSESITSALQEQSVSLDTDNAAAVIADSISNAIAAIELPEIQVNTDNVSIPIDVPSGGIPINTSNLSIDLGDSVGSALRDRLEVVEGRSSSNLEEVNNILDSLEGIDLEVISSLSVSIDSINETADSLRESLAAVQTSLTEQEERILREIDFRINQRFNEENTENNILARVGQNIQLLQQDITRIDGLVGKAMSMAGRAMSFAQARV